MLPKSSRSVNLAAANAAHTVPVNEANSLLVSIFSAASANTVQLIFEGRSKGDGQWVGLACRPSNSTTAGTLLAQPAALSAIPAFGWYVNTNGLCEFRVRVVSLTAGGVQVDIGYSEQPTL